MCIGSIIIYYLYDKKIKNKPSKFDSIDEEVKYNKETDKLYLMSIILGLPLIITIIIVIILCVITLFTH